MLSIDVDPTIARRVEARSAHRRRTRRPRRHETRSAWFDGRTMSPTASQVDQCRPYCGLSDCLEDEAVAGRVEGGHDRRIGGDGARLGVITCPATPWREHDHGQETTNRHPAWRRRRSRTACTRGTSHRAVSSRTDAVFGDEREALAVEHSDTDRHGRIAHDVTDDRSRADERTNRRASRRRSRRD